MNKPKKRKFMICASIAVIVIGVLISVIIFSPDSSKESNPASSFSNVSLSVHKIKMGSITNSISNTGTASVAAINTIRTPITSKISEFFVSVGTQIKPGDPLFSYEPEALNNLLDELNEKLAEEENKGYAASGKDETKVIKAPQKGRIKMLTVKKNSLTSDIPANSQAAVISTAATMYFDINSKDMKLDDIVSVKIGKDTKEGKVISLENGKARIEIGTDTFEVGAKAVVLNEDGAEKGAGELYLSEYEKVDLPDGKVTSVYVKENKIVSFGDKIFAVKVASTELKSIYLKIDELKKEIEQVTELIEDPVVKVQEAGIVSELLASTDETIEKEAKVMTVKPMNAFEVVIIVNEKDLEKVFVGQEATLTLTNGTKIKGTVTHINYNAKEEDGAVNMFDVHVQAADEAMLESKKILPGMSTDVDITLEGKENILKAPLDGVYQDSEGYYVMIYNGEGDIDAYGNNVIPKTKKYVETGISNERYIEILSGVAEGDEIVVTRSSNDSMFEKPEVYTDGMF